MFRPLKQITPDQIEETLKSLGYNLTSDGDFWRTSANYRGGTNPTSVSVSKTSGVWQDFGTNVGSLPFSKLVELSGGGKVGVDSSNSPVPKTLDPDDDNQPERIYPDSMLDRLLPHHSVYIQKGIPVQVLKRLKAGLAMGGAMYSRYVFPIFNQEGKIIGFDGRDVSANKDGKRPKWKKIGSKKKWLYPFYTKDELGQQFVKDAIEQSGEVIIVESIGDCLKLHSWGIFNVLVCFGLKISDAIICKLLELAPEKIYICLNNDNEGGFNNGLNASVENYLNMLRYFDSDSLAILLPIKNDFGDMDDSDFKIWQEKKKKFDFAKQKSYICEKTREMPKISKDDNFFSRKDNKRLLWVGKTAFKNLKYLKCEEC